MTSTPHAAEYEEEHVHQIYDQIASHFSSTRYKPWPLVEQFLNDLPVGSIGLDVGCGNGKYLSVNSNVYMIGSDRSPALIKIATQRGVQSTVVADSLNLPHPNGIFDFAISIAVVHHLSTSARRVSAINRVLQVLRPLKQQIAEDASFPNEAVISQVQCGKALIYVWALEQRDSRRGWSESDEQDIMVPWVMKQKGKRPESDSGMQQETQQRTHPDVSVISSSMPATQSSDRVFERYYHLFRAGELESNIVEAGGTVLKSGYEKDNWWAVAIRQQH
ncbi:MAG: tRNA methyltransferase, has a role in tRNA modification [Piccolia ochrophora]|nr:MAG: tRNA methyltransferase, has a role in tRNA modification [Piccolia ochrophora]